MSRLFTFKRTILFFSFICLLMLPLIANAGGMGGMGGCCGGHSGSSYYASSLYYPTNYQDARLSSALGYYPNVLGYGGGISPYYGTGISPYYGGGISPYYGGGFGSFGTPYAQPYSLGSLYSPYSSLGYANPYGQQSVSQDQSVEQSYSYFVPGGMVTTTVSEGVEYTQYPQVNPYSYMFSNPYSLGSYGYGLGGINTWI